MGHGWDTGRFRAVELLHGLYAGTALARLLKHMELPSKIASVLGSSSLEIAALSSVQDVAALSKERWVHIAFVENFVEKVLKIFPQCHFGSTIAIHTRYTTVVEAEPDLIPLLASRRCKGSITAQLSGRAALAE